MKILVLSGSPRKNGNTDLLVKAFADGAARQNEVEVIRVADYVVNPCVGCNACFVREGNRCFQGDDMDWIYDALMNADMLVIASPIYFYGVSAQLKAVIDRCHSPFRNRFKIKKMALLLVAASDLPEVFDAILTQYTLILNFFHLEDAGKVFVRKVKDKGDIIGNPALEDARRLGESV